MKRLILGLIIFAFSKIMLSRDIFVQFDFFADDKLVEMTTGGKPITVPPNGYELQATIPFLATLGQPIIMKIDNLQAPSGPAPMGIAGFFTVGTSRFSTQGPDKGWSGYTNFDSTKIYSVNGTNYLMYGSRVNGGIYKFTFNIPNDETYCSSKKPDGNPIINYANGKLPSIIPISEMIYPFIDTSYSFKLTRLPSKGKLFNENNQELTTNQPYDLKNIIYESNEIYKQDSFQYTASSWPTSQPCDYIIYSCYSSCSTCNDKTDTSDDQHNCLSCKDTHAKVELIQTNCLERGKQHDKVYFDEKSDLFKQCQTPCVNCESLDKCITCIQNHYQIENEVPGSCYNKDSILLKEKDYYLDSRESPHLYKECYFTCDKCLKGKDNEEHYCNNCKPEYAFYEGKASSSCYNFNDNLGYFYDETINKYFECYNTCAKCNDIKGTSIKNDCKKCKDNHSFYEGKDPTSCYLTTPWKGEQEGYLYEDPSNTYLTCQPSCKYCTEKGSASMHYCKTCKAGYYFIYGTTFCIMKNDTDKTHYDLSKYYFDLSDSTFKRCFLACLTCSKGGDEKTNNCDSCDVTQRAFIETELQQKNCVLKGNHPGFYYDSSINTYMKCYYTCAECIRGGDIRAHNCEKCAANHYFNPVIQTNCMPCKKYWIIDINDAYICVDECNNEYSYLIPDLNQCVVKCPPRLPFDYLNICYEECPLDTIEINGDHCLGRCFPDQWNKPNQLDYRLDECLSVINANILVYHRYQHHITGIDFSFQVYSNYSSVIGIPDNSSVIYFSKCEEILKEVNRIPSTDYIIYAKFDILTEKENITNRVEYSAYDSQGKPLDLSSCPKESITVSYYIKDIDSLIVSIAVEYNTIGIDIFNFWQAFYNDICYYNREMNHSYTLQYRRDYIFPHLSFCEVNCNYTSFNYTIPSAKCICTPKSKVEPSRVYQTQKLVFDPLPSTNLAIFQCAGTLFQPNNLKNSFGFYLIGVFLLTNISLSIVYYTKGMKAIYPNLYSAKSKINTINLDIGGYQGKSQPSSNSALLQMKNSILTSVDKAQLPQLPYLIAKKTDNRSIWHMFFDIAQSKILLFRALKPISPFEVKFLQIFHIFFVVAITFTSNALILQDSILSNLYVNITMFYLLVTLTSLASCFITGIVSCCMKKLILFDGIFDQLIQERDDKVIFKIKKALNQISKRIFLYYLIAMSTLCACWYYSSIFCLIYHDQQVLWLILGVVNIALSLGAQLILCLIIACCRFYSIVNQSKRLYLFSSYLHNSW